MNLTLHQFNAEHIAGGDQKYKLQRRNNKLNVIMSTSKQKLFHFDQEDYINIKNFSHAQELSKHSENSNNKCF